MVMIGGGQKRMPSMDANREGEVGMTELERCLAGEYYNCHDLVFLEMKGWARSLLQRYNSLQYGRKEEKEAILR